ncbi:MAG: glycosyltransferase [Gemmatimonadales bacterium]
MNRRVRVLHLIDNLNYGGMERVLADLVHRLDPEQFECHVLGLAYLGRFAEGLDSSAGLHVADPMPRGSMLWPGSLARQIRRLAPDVVHTHSGVWYKGSLAARLAGVPRLVHTDHGRPQPDPWTGRLLDRIAAGRTDVVVAVSEPLAELLVRRVGVSARRLTVVQNGVDTARHRPREDAGRVRRELGLCAEAPVLGSIGRLEPIKGYDLMLEAFARLRGAWNGGEPPVLVIAGGGSEQARLASWADRAGVGGGVRLPGWRDDVAELHATFTLFTLASRSEGTSISLLEAMSAGLCPVVTDVGGNANVLGPGLAHRLVPPNDPDALARAWRAALLDPAARCRDAEAARRRVLDGFALDGMVKAYQRLYLGAGS